jgi:hypothetical protein
MQLNWRLTASGRVNYQSHFTTAVLPPISSSRRQAPWESWHSNFIFQLNTCGYSPYVTSPLTRGWVCSLQLLLGLASAVILRSDYRETRDHILLSQIRESPNLEGQVLVFISPRNRIPISSPPTTRRVTVEVFDLASTRDRVNCCWLSPAHSCQGPNRERRLLQFVYCWAFICSRGNVFKAPLPSKSRSFFHYSAFTRHVTI